MTWQTLQPYAADLLIVLVLEVKKNSNIYGWTWVYL
jgi:hypothetical protein